MLEERDVLHEKIKLTTWSQLYSGVLASTDFHSLSVVTRAASESPIYLVAREKGADLDKVATLHTPSHTHTPLHTPAHTHTHTPTHTYAQMELLTWSGTEQLDQPHLLAYSASLVRNVHQWIMFQPASPWVGLLNPLGAYIPEGVWRVVSSDAFLTGNNWFVLFSGGLLQPRIKRIQVSRRHLMCSALMSHVCMYG